MLGDLLAGQESPVEEFRHLIIIIDDITEDKNISCQ